MNWLQILMIIAGLFSFIIVVGNGLAISRGEEGIPNIFRIALIGLLLCCVLFYPLAGEACEEQFRESIDKECDQSYFNCVSWEELEAAIESR